MLVLENIVTDPELSCCLNPLLSCFDRLQRFFFFFGLVSACLQKLTQYLNLDIDVLWGMATLLTIETQKEMWEGRRETTSTIERWWKIPWIIQRSWKNTIGRWLWMTQFDESTVRWRARMSYCLRPKPLLVYLRGYSNLTKGEQNNSPDSWTIIDWGEYIVRYSYK